MDSLSGRARLLVIAAFVLSAGLFGTAAVAYVVASRDDGPKKAGPTVHPTVIIPTQEPSATPSPTAAPTTSPTPAASPTASPSPRPAVASPSPSPKPRVTTSRSPSPKPVAREGLASEAHTDGARANEKLVVTAHATDGDGVIYLRSVDWGDGPITMNQRGAACSPAAKTPADCRNYTVSHTYTQPGHHVVRLVFVSGSEMQTLDLSVTITAAPSGTPSPTG